jgi:hypothetical protein
MACRRDSGDIVMAKWIVRAGTTLVVAQLAVGSTAAAQSLAEVARKEAERRGATPEAGRVYTNDNLTPDFTKPVPPAPPPGSTPPAAAAAAPEATAAAPAPAAPAADAAKADEPTVTSPHGHAAPQATPAPAPKLASNGSRVPSFD